MRAFRYLLLFSGVLAFAACSDDEGGRQVTDIPPLAYTRFVHAVPDTGATDWRFVDILDFSPAAFGMTYRQFTPYQGTHPGTHTLRIFPTSEDITVTSTRMIDQEVTFEAGQYYTIVHTGFADPGAATEDHIVIYQDPIPGSIAAGTYALRGMHHGVGWGPVDVYAPASTTAALPGTPLFAGLDYEEATAYQTMNVGAVALRALPAGQTVPLMTAANATAPAGAAADPDDNLTAIGGTTIEGSAITAIFMPGSVLGTSAPQTGAFVSSTEDVTLRATATGFERSTGSFITDNFFIGQQIEIADFGNAANNGTAVVTGLTDNVRTGNITMAATATSFTRTTGSFVTNGFTPGMQIYVTGFPAASGNNGIKTVATVTALAMTVVEPLTVAAAAASRSICQNPCTIMTVTKAGGTVAEAANGEASIRGPRPAWVYIVDRHPR